MKTTLTFFLCLWMAYTAVGQIQVTENSPVANDPNSIGFNNNTTLTEEPWNNPDNILSLQASRAANLRFPGGTVSENWDYRNDTFFPAKGTPGDADGWIDPDKMIGFVKSIIQNGSGKKNSVENFARAQRANDLQPVYVMNMTTPGLDYYAEKFGVPEESPTFEPLGDDWWRAFEDRLQRNLEALRRAEAAGMPVKFVELSNEVYFGAGQYQFKNFQGFRADNAGTGYPEACHYFATEIEKEFPQAKFAAVAYFNTDNTSGRRKDFWNGYVLPRLDRNLIDALTMHAYIESTPNQTATSQAELNTMLGSVEEKISLAKTNSQLDDIVGQQNWDIWWTEAMPNFFRLGGGTNPEAYRWENALVLSYNISAFLEVAGSKLIQIHQLKNFTTNDGGVKAAGRAMALASLASTGMTQRQALSFSGTANLSGTEVPELFGFSFSDSDNKNFWITNASGESKTLDISSLGFSGKVLHQAVGTLGSSNDPLETVSLPGNTITLPPNSVSTLLTTDQPAISLAAGADATLQNEDTYDFGMLRLGSAGVQTDFTITNLGGGTLDIATVNITGAQAGDFTIVQQPDFTLANRESAQLTIKFDPKGDGVRTATVTIESNDSNTPVFRLNLTGTTSRDFAFNRLDETVINDGFKDIPYRGNDAGAQGTGLRLTSMGRVNDQYTIWRVRNSSDENQQVTLKSVDNSFEKAFTIKKNKEAFVRSTYTTDSGTHKLFLEGNLLSTKASSNSTFSDGRTVFVARNGNVGGASPSGRVRTANGTFTMEAAGAGIGGNSDQFRYIFEELKGNFAFTTKLASASNPGTFGIMVRKSNAANSENLFFGLSDASQLVLQTRGNRGDTTKTISSVDATAPVWLKINRVGNRFTSSYSSDGTTFQVLESTVVVFPFKVRVGLAGSSTVNGQLATASFQEAVINPNEGQPEPDIAIYDEDATLLAGNSLNFGLVELNTSKTLQISLTNIGTKTLQITDLVIGGSDASLFTFENDDVSSLKIGESTDIDVTFTASQSSTRSARLEVTSSDPDTPELVISLLGQGPGNILQNGDFENATRDPWANAGTVVDDVSESRSGTKALRLFLPPDTPENNRFLGAVQTVNVQPLGQYTVQGYFKGGATSSTGAFRIFVRILDASGNVVGDASSNFFNNAGDYRLMTVSFAVPEGGTQVEVIPQILAATGTAWFDDLEMADNTNPAPTTILRNGGFDSNQRDPWANGGQIEDDTVNASGKVSPILKLFRSNKGFGGARQVVSVNEGSTYNLSGSVKRNLTEGFARFFIQFLDENGDYVVGDDGKNITRATQFGRFGGVDLTYKFIGLNGITPPTGAQAMEINLQLFNGAGGVWWEDIRLEEILPASEANLAGTGASDLFSAYPNPTSDVLNVRLTNAGANSATKAHEISQLLIYDMTGTKMVNSLSGSFNGEDKSISIPVGALREGLYILKVVFSDGSTQEKRIQIK
ncbi:choice-of-anchor D domain-containing protein [Tunicatimonas pelagia]|uniref:choice-of-anchor D domain-containing protein n=1 Tax=Tunicatimonas pelagia TaxID=931531 RepID=UPI0026659DBB|nr:choice-of-anchor D domain-containing protein [Tunicatimonas pelagia]WKN43755.1 choice-of-anchor D domain-containing protein [Tunicatimonas pelagia]